ncbi:MBL fold metallo-hydrolase [Solemya elarraichensis gill symbiont]|uniref:Metallo-beta-lactamase domain-containing protein n=1 Tax=Solemya elarraichensis gill symbiont TaxID=1918949 RepID=A0A1T2LCQ6_9GAMM|nr:MBL fold metallo-hydrolase [Solemya elarraichensis gill symbiont]OOZ42869.1 hypothetical protein BOW52_01145 [Solemya elarraichensis gill symbiont]
MKLRSLFLTAIVVLVTTSLSWAEEPLELKLQTVKISDTIYAIIGPTTNRDKENLGNNANFGLIITDEGAILIDSGGTYQGAEMLHNSIKSITDKPVKIVINSGGQDHRWMGNSYFKALGARLIASSAAVEDQQARSTDQLIGLGILVGDEGLEGTETVYADETFDEQMTLELGGEKIEIYHAGAAHTPGDSFIWVPSQQVVFSGDIIYVQRMLGVGSMSSSSSWLEVFDALAALEPKHIVPGHGPVTTLERATKVTRGYLTFIRSAVGEFMGNGGTMDAISEVDLSSYTYLENHETLNGRNAQQVYSELEWE